jgi:DNA polymerase-3 subunit delta'
MFDQLVGNDRVKRLLLRTLESGRLPGALLFTGEEGVGKKLFAVELARALNCPTPKNNQGCGECGPCKRAANFNYPSASEAEDFKAIIWSDHADLGLVVAPKRLLVVEQMRQIEREANFRPYEGKARFFLVEDADKLNDSSANALLKVLEEPPHTSHIILMTSRPAMLLPTILSRCQMIRFGPVTPEEIEDYLVKNKLASPAEARVRARVARGSLGRAIEQDFEEFSSQRKSMLRLLEALATGKDQMQLLKSSEELNSAQQKEEYEVRLDVLEALIRDAWMLGLKAPSEGVANIDLLPQLQKIGNEVESWRPARWISQIEELREQLVVNINRKVATDALFLTMANATQPPPKRRFLIK